VHGDVRVAADVAEVGSVDLLVECSAEPSVHAGPGYMVSTNLVGLINCLEHLYETGGRMVFLSSSRVYPIQALRDAAVFENEHYHARPVSESFPLAGRRSLYGAAKLAGEILIEDYGVPACVLRLGVVAGPWQFGRVDQGFVSHWVKAHLDGTQLAYHNYDGYQVRDVLHVDDLCKAIVHATVLEGVFNVGGGMYNAPTLRGLTDICRRLTGRFVEVGSTQALDDNDVPYYVTNHAKFSRETGWEPELSVEDVVRDIVNWYRSEA